MTKAAKNPEVRYRRQLNALVASLRAQVRTRIYPILKALEPEYVNDAYARTLEEAFDNLRKLYVGLEPQARSVATSFVEGANSANKKRFYGAVNNAIGVDMTTVIQNEGLEDILVASTRENVSLIKSIPDQYLTKVESIVFNGTTQGSKASSMITQLVEAGNVTAKRAKLIARDQSSKLNSAFTQQRSQNLGVEEYIWITAKDGDRVRLSHRKNHGKTFRWDDPPKDTGHPGNDIQCRCVAQPIINV